MPLSKPIHMHVLTDYNQGNHALLMHGFPILSMFVTVATQNTCRAYIRQRPDSSILLKWSARNKQSQTFH